MILSAAGVILWELSIALFCWRWFAQRGANPLQRAGLWLGGQIMVAGLLATATTFLKLNSQLTWVVLALALVAACWKTPGPHIGLDAIPKWLIVSAAPLLALILRPVSEVDSLFNLHYVFGWIDEGASPYQFAFHYVPFWEMTGVPLLTLGRSDTFLFLAPLKSLALLATLLIALAEVFGLVGWLRVLAVGQALLFPHLWQGHSGVATYKNDLMAASGAAALLLGMLRAHRASLGLWEKALLAGGAVFVSTKFSGPVLLLLLAPLALWVLRNCVRTHWRWLVFSALLWLAASGHVYARNFALFGNPVYPFSLRLGPIQLPGRGDLSSTSLLYNLHLPEVWQLLFLPTGGISPLGLLFPIAFALLVPFCLTSRGRPVVSYFYLVSLFVYLRSIFSASGFSGDLQFVRNDLNSMRYFEGAYLAGELFLASFLAGRSRAQGVLLGLNGLSRLYLLVRRAPIPVELSDVLLAVGGASVLLAGLWILGRKSALAGLAAAIVGGALCVESRRSSWLPDWRALYEPIYRSPAASVYLVVDDEYGQQACAHLPVKGRRFQHQVRSGPARLAGRVDYIFWLRAALSSQPEFGGYRIVAQSAAGLLLAREHGEVK